MWPQFIVDSFNRVGPNAGENEFYGPWNSVLFCSFSLQEGYEIVPHRPVAIVTTGENDSTDSAVTYTVMRDDATIFFVEVQAPKYLSKLYHRAEADAQMRRRFTQLYDSSPSIMHGVSAFGSRVCLYELDKNAEGKIVPSRAAQPSDEYVVDVAPEDRWNPDILEEEGYTKFIQAVGNAKLAGPKS